MSIAPVILFILRLFFYLSVAFLVHVHPGIVVSYDRVSMIQWFLCIPLGALLGFIPSPLGKLKYKLLGALVILGAIAVWNGSFWSERWPLLFFGLGSFTLTLLLFHYPRWGKLSILEPFFLAWICFRLLVFSRSGEDAAGQSMGITQFILVWTAVVFLFHSAVVYFSLFPGSDSSRREGLLFGLASALVLVVLVFFLPPDFVRNTMVSNLLQDRIERRSQSSDSDFGLPDTDGGRRQGRPTIPGDDGAPSPSLRGLSEHDWPSDIGRGRRPRGIGEGEDGSQSQQYTVMVVASEKEPVYMGSAIRGLLDPVEGFLYSHEESLARLSTQRFFVTWFDHEPVFDRGREHLEVFALSTLSQKFLPYRPFSIDPTIQSENSGPFRYIHRLVSQVHPEDPLGLIGVPIRALSVQERIDLAPYLEINLGDEDREVFTAHLDRVMDSWEIRRPSVIGNFWNDYMERIAAILLGFSTFQYHVNNSYTATVADLVSFLEETRTGDCVEFSHTAALLGRYAGIPSRVVSGYLAADSLQSNAHIRGLAALRSQIPVLQEFPLDQLYLVTDAHGHAWTQFYIPDYGWLDFEATAFAIPPLGSGDGNLRDVVIPIIDDGPRLLSRVRAFPWRALLRILGYLGGFSLGAAYALRYGREILLWARVRRGGAKGARNLYLLLLAKLAADGRPIKPVSATAPEYARLFDEAPPPEGSVFSGFAELYTELRWRTFIDKNLEEEKFRALIHEYEEIRAFHRRRGPLAFLRRIFSLKGLAYL
ncbi:MAG: transglutaminase domain-containing protein [Treponema sp.]|nr:transglutaminase domain-containing protein [Treponema sp.]